MNPQVVNAAAVIGGAAWVVTFVMEKSACLGLPAWVVPVLTVAQMALMWAAKSPIDHK